MFGSEQHTSRRPLPRFRAPREREAHSRNVDSPTFHCDRCRAALERDRRIERLELRVAHQARRFVRARRIDVWRLFGGLSLAVCGLAIAIAGLGISWRISASGALLALLSALVVPTKVRVSRTSARRCRIVISRYRHARHKAPPHTTNESFSGSSAHAGDR